MDKVEILLLVLGRIIYYLEKNYNDKRKGL